MILSFPESPVGCFNFLLPSNFYYLFPKNSPLLHFFLLINIYSTYFTVFHSHVNLYQFCAIIDYIYFYPEVIPYERIPVISQKLYVPSSFKGYF